MESSDKFTELMNDNEIERALWCNFALNNHTMTILGRCFHPVRQVNSPSSARETAYAAFRFTAC